MLRLADRNAADHAMIHDAVASRLAAGTTLHVAPQVVIEFWVVSTRPREVNGFGLEPSVVAASVQGLLGQFTLLEEGPAVFSTWLGLVSAGVRGKRAHDARLAAVALTNGVSQLLTMNVADYSGLAGLVVVHPGSIMKKT